jgi:hypothetical protein
MSAIKPQLVEMTKAYDSGDVLSMAEMIDLIDSDQFKKENIYCFCQGELDEYIPSLSVTWKNNKFVFYKSKKTIEEEVDVLEKLVSSKREKRSFIKKFIGRKFVIYIEPYYSTKETLYKELLKCCELIRYSSLNVRNYDRDKRAIHLKQLRTQMENDSGFDARSLARFLSKIYNVNPIVFYLLPNGRTKLDKSGKNRTYLLDFLENEYADFVLECKKNGKPIAWKCYDDKKIFYHCLIPIVGKSQKPLLLTEFILFWDYSKFKISIINNIIELIDTYTSLKHQQNRLLPLLELHKELISHIQNAYFKVRATHLKKFESFSTKCLTLIVDSTYTHSATIRLYEPYDKSLVLFKEIKSEWGKRKKNITEKDYSHIPIKRFRASLNAFTFLKNSNQDSYSYINNVNDKIPVDLKKMGLNEILKHRDSLSEICFPLLCGDIAFGTLNIESSIRNAYSDSDIEYLFSIKRAIESFYVLSLKNSDAKWLAGRSPVYRNVHELSQLLRLKKKYFNKEQTALLKRLIVLDDSSKTIQKIKLVKLKTELLLWIKKQVDPIKYEIISQNLIFDINKKQNVSGEFFENLLLICKNLFENIISHGDPERDKFIIVQDDYLRMGVNANLKIFIKSFGYFDSANYSSLFVSPILKDEELHYGLFLVGVLARKVGGMALISQGDGASPHTIIEVTMPLVSV